MKLFFLFFCLLKVGALAQISIINQQSIAFGGSSSTDSRRVQVLPGFDAAGSDKLVLIVGCENGELESARFGNVEMIPLVGEE